MSTEESMQKECNQPTMFLADSADQKLSEILILMKSIDEKLDAIVLAVREINRRG